jgi:hypothetical protein
MFVALIATTVENVSAANGLAKIVETEPQSADLFQLIGLPG